MYAPRTGPLGRHEEGAQIERLLDAASNGPVGLALEGAPGIGKTTLWRDALASARGRGYAVVATTPSEPDASLAFAGLGDLLDELPDRLLAGLPDPQRRALAAALFVEDAAGAPADPQALPRSVLAVLRGLATDAPLLVAIDDEQWLDPASARVLAFALCRLREERICLLLTRRPQSDGALWPELARGFGSDGLAARLLGPLDMGAIHDLLARRLNRVIPRPLLRRIYDASGGNPLYALAIARELEAASAAGADDDALPLPPTLADAVAGRLARLDSAAEAPLLVVAALANPTLALIQAVLPEFTLSDLDSAQRTGVVEVIGERVRFTHPLLASTHYSRAPEARRRKVHRLAAEVVDDEVERAHHLALGAEAPDRQLAVILEHAAELAARRGAPEIAAELLDHAWRLTPTDALEARRSRTVSAAEQHYAAGDVLKSRSRLEELMERLPPGAIRARALLALAKVRMDDFDASAALLDEALTQADAHHRVNAKAEALLSELWSNRGNQAAAIEHARAAVTHAEQTDDPGLLAGMLGTQGIMEFFSGDGVQHEVMARAIELQEHAHSTPSYYVPSTQLGNQLFWSDQLDAARPLLERSLRRAVERGEEVDRGALLFHLAHLEWEAGNRVRAEGYTSETAELIRQIADDQGECYVFWLQAFVAARQGRLEEAGARANDAIEVAGRIGDQFIVSFSTAILAGIDLWTGRPESAHERLPPLREALVGDGRGFVGSLTLNLWSYDIEALLALGRLDEVEAVLEDLFQRARRAANPNALAIAHRCQGLLTGARGDAADAIAAMDEALAEHARRLLPLELGRTLLEKGTLERRAKRKSAAKRSLEQALAVLEPLSAAIWASRARDELTRIGLRRSAHGDGLTPAQQRVAELVAAGMSNREIAGELFMSLRTVETHLTKIYRELGVKSRAQLVAIMAGQGSGETEKGEVAEVGQASQS
ncbi:MAG TPA: AAA family ATPase [Solirubrobacteraceae bacterium]|nr:AAA family ATPase [Solirubrobacteraceae bacterium]